MWYLVVDQLYRDLSKVDMFVDAYADDVIIIFRVDDKEVLLSLMWFVTIILFANRYKVGSLPELIMFSKEITVGKEANGRHAWLEVELEEALRKGMRQGHASGLGL